MSNIPRDGYALIAENLAMAGSMTGLGSPRPRRDGRVNGKEHQVEKLDTYSSLHLRILNRFLDW